MAARRPARRQRADARRNRSRILAAAAEVFGEMGAEGGVAEIARRAGVGHATVFRHFPTKDALLVALTGARMEELADRADAEATREPHGEGLERFMAHLAERMADDRGVVEVSTRAHAFTPELADQRRLLHSRVGVLLRIAHTAGRARGDLRPEDVFMLCAAVGQTARESLAAPNLWRRYLTIVLDGVRTAAPTRLPVAAPDLTDLEAHAHPTD
ncbi:MAG TPA: helix-turn-helix domain-containing protein [Miltoncostaeaceae bacterium]|nr:helix-turn-helix domain-containing protein [Miltoncostaeaceae bacterium]